MKPLNPLLTPLPASLSSGFTRSTPEQSADMAAEQAQQLSDMLPQGLTPPGLVDAILCDHRQSLALFTHFFRAAAAAEAAASRAAAGGMASTQAGGERFLMKMAAGALAIDLHLHAHAQEEVLLHALEKHCGPTGVQLAANSRHQHAAMGAEIDSLLQALLEDQQAQQQVVAGSPDDAGAAGVSQGPAPATVSSAREASCARRQALLKRMEGLEASYIAHQTELEASCLPRIAAAVPASEQRALAAAYYHSKRSAHLLLPGGAASASSSGGALAGAAAAGGEPARKEKKESEPSQLPGAGEKQQGGGEETREGGQEAVGTPAPVSGLAQGAGKAQAAGSTLRASPFQAEDEAVVRDVPTTKPPDKWFDEF